MNAEALAHALGGVRAGRQWVARCPAHDDRKPSLLIFDGKEQVQVRCKAGCEPLDVIRALIAAKLWEGDAGNEPVQQRQRQHDDGAEARRNSELALRIWDDGVDPHGTLAETYLWGRDLVLPQDTRALRFHPACPRGKERWPALIAMVCPLESHRPVAIQRIYLKANATKDGAMMLGPWGNAAIKLTPHYATFSEDLLWCPRLFVCEGLETGIALLQRGFAPVWALGSCGGIERLPVLFGVGELVICADNDPPGLSAAKFCAERWNKSPRQRAVIRIPPTQGHDFADGMGDAV